MTTLWGRSLLRLAGTGAASCALRVSWFVPVFVILYSSPDQNRYVTPSSASRGDAMLVGRSKAAPESVLIVSTVLTFIRL